MTAGTLTGVGRLERIRELAGELAARDRWPAAKLRAHRRDRLRALLDHAVAASPYYRETLGADAVADTALSDLPTLTKATLMEEFDRIVTDPRLRVADLEAHLGGPDPGKLFLGEYRVFATSGSSGLAGIVAFTADEFTFWIAAHLPVFARMGIGPTTRLAAIGAPSPIHLTKQLFAAFQAGRPDTPRLSVMTPLPELVAALNSYRPEALIGYPSIMALLAEEQLDDRLEIEPRILALGAEVLTEEMEERILSAWGVRPFQVYAATEAPLLAASGPDDDALHVCGQLVVLEVVDEDNRPVRAGAPGHKVLVTNLVNRAQPLIRYELTDSVTIAPHTGASALDQRIARIDGRSDDVLHLPGRHGGEVAVHPYRLRAPFAPLADVSRYQIVHDGRSLHVGVVLRPTAAPGTVEQVRRVLQAALDDAGVAGVPVVVEAVSALEREPGHAAKLKLVKTLSRV